MHRLLASLDMASDSEADAEEKEASADESPPPDGAEEGEGEGEEQDAEDAKEMETAADSADELEEGAMEDADAPSAEIPDGADAGESEEAAENRPAGPSSAERRGPDYKAYTTKFDEVVDAEDLCDPDELQRLRDYLDKQLQNLSSVVSRLANRLQRRLMAQQNRAWEFDLEEGMLDAARLSRVVIDPQQPLSFKQEKDMDFRDTVVTLLIDNSGSMRGRPITVAASCADILARTLERCGVKVEILGFTTRAWKGGQSREAWLAAGKPANPGRLNDLRHLIYKSADAPWRRVRKNLGLMMREGLLKENIDGEALDWAHQRLLGTPRAAAHPDDDLRRRAGRRFDAFGQRRQLSRAPSAPRDRGDRDALAGRAHRHRHRPRRHPLLSPRRDDRRRRGTRRRDDGEARRTVRREGGAAEDGAADAGEEEEGGLRVGRRRRLRRRPFVGDDLAVVGQSARGDELHRAAHLGDALQRRRDLLREPRSRARDLGGEDHRVLLAFAADDEPESAELGMALADFGDLRGMDEHALDLGRLVGAAHPALDARARGRSRA